MAFSQLNLDQNINKALVACGYTTPTPVQAKAIPEILLGKDLVASAQTGTGKTAAFVLPALHHLATQAPLKKPRILVLTPTRELADQITKAANKYGKYLRFNIISLVGGMPYHRQIRDLQRGADIIVATPDRLMDHMEQGRVDVSSISMLVLDEADRMLDMGFIEDVQYIAKLIPNKRQTLLFSATVDKKLTTVVGHLLKSPVRIDLSQEKLTAPQIRQEFYRVNNQHHKNRLLSHLLTAENIFKAIIFTATKVNADRLADQLCDEGFTAAPLHGDLRQNVRNRTVEQLRSGRIQFIVATDVAARGIDISDVTHVINYDLPKFSEDYVHRIGRTGRAGKDGVAFSFVSPMEFSQLQRIERYLGQRFQLINQAGLADDKREGKREMLSLRDKPTSNRDYFLEDEDQPKKNSAREVYKARKGGHERDERGSFARGDNSKSGRDGKSRFSRDDKPSFGERKPRSNRDIKPRHADGKSRFAHDDRAGLDDHRSSAKPKFARDENRSRFSRDDKPSSRKPAGRSFNRDERSGDKKSFSRDEKPVGKKPFSRDEKPTTKKSFSRDERSVGKKGFSRDEKSTTGKKSFGRDERSAGKKTFGRDDKPRKSARPSGAVKSRKTNRAE
jgi:superfamily II DNA/RNA helicase